LGATREKSETGETSKMGRLRSRLRFSEEAELLYLNLSLNLNLHIAESPEELL
jgi:hypothetical protein